MKRTTFEIDVQVATQNAEKVLSTVSDQLAALIGVEQVSHDPTSAFDRLLIVVTFNKSDEAKTIHSKVMSLLAGIPSLRITGLTTTLTDVFE